MKNYTIGIDMGINNVGWAVLDNANNKIVDYGVRLFDPSTGAEDRRNARGIRRRKKREFTRIKDILYLMNSIGFPNKVTIDTNLLEKRCTSLKQKVNKQDITNILCYMASHRGYIPFGDEEETFIELNNQLPCLFYYDMYKKFGKYRNSNKIVRNSDNLKEVVAMLTEQKKYYSEINDEFIYAYTSIFTRRRKFWEGPGSINSVSPYGRFKNQADINEYLDNKKTNPNYEKYLFEDLIATDKLSIKEKCSPKLNLYNELFDFLNDFINISFENIEDINSKNFFYKVKTGNYSGYYKLNSEGLNAVKEYCLNNYKISSYKAIFKDVFGMKFENASGYRINHDNKPEFSTLNGYRKICKYFLENNCDISWTSDFDFYNNVVKALNVAPGLVELSNMVDGIDNNYKFNDKGKSLLNELRIYFKKNNMLGYSSLSESTLTRAINDMLKLHMNFMQIKNLNHYDDLEKNYYIEIYKNSNKVSKQMIPDFVDDIISSPQVKKSLRQSISIINELIKKYGIPQTIAVESTKDLNGKDMKSKIEKEQRQREKLRNEAIAFITKNFCNNKINETNITKVMLYKETDGHCMYCNKPIDPNELIKDSFQIEHILPISKSCDNSYNNLTIACLDCNSRKKARTPYQFLVNDFETFSDKVEHNQNLSEDKKFNLLFDKDIDKYSTRFFNRNLRDTAYATKELINQINIFNYYLEDQKINRINTLSTPGQLTNKLRDRITLPKDRDDGKHHHAVDASIVASIATTDIGKVIIESQNDRKFWIKNKDNDFGNLIKNVNLSSTIDQIKAISEDNTKYSSQVKKNYQGQLSNSNYYKVINKNGNYYKIESIDNIYEYDFYNLKNKEKFEKLLNNEDDSPTLLCYDNDKKTFNYIKEIYYKYEPNILATINSKDKKNKINPFIQYLIDSGKISNVNEFNPLINGIQVISKSGKGPFIKKLRYYEAINYPYILNKENINNLPNTFIALDSLKQNCTQVYIDLDNKKFVFIPIYSISINSKTGKIDSNNQYYKFFYDKYLNGKNTKHIVDLYNGNIFEVTKKNGKKIKGIYSGYNKTLNVIKMKSGDSFAQGDTSITVYDCDVLGNMSKRLTY